MSDKRLYPNLRPKELAGELAIADSLGIESQGVTDSRFREFVELGLVKWALVPDGGEGTIKIVPSIYQTRELKHTVINRGMDVYAAGEAAITVSPEGKYRLLYLLRYIDDHSGHYQPGPEAVEAGLEGFKRAGVNVDTAQVRITGK